MADAISRCLEKIACCLAHIASSPRPKFECLHRQSFQRYNQELSFYAGVAQRLLHFTVHEGYGGSSPLARAIS